MNKVHCALYFVFLAACGGGQMQDDSTSPVADSSEPSSSGATTGVMQGDLAERTYCEWIDPTTEAAAAALISLGYARPALAEEDSRVLVAEPRNGHALRVELFNDVGTTRVQVRVLPSGEEDEVRITELFTELDRTLRTGDCS